jgi:asparagine synthase (glutamine-hydrolysing)
MEYLVKPRFMGTGLPSGSTKVVLKALARRTFDASFVYRPKGGFKLPLLEFFRDSQFQQLMREQIIPGMRRRGLLNARTIENWWQNLERLSPDMHEVLWISISFELWARRFIDQQLSKPHGHIHH